jgi:hypothetical protein
MTKLLSILIFLTLLLNLDAYSQKGKLHIQLKILPELEQFLKTEKINIRITGNTILERQTVGEKQDIYFDSLKTGKFTIQINSYIHKDGIDKEYRFMSEFIINKTDSTTIIKMTFPADCKFNRHSLNKVCPKCKRTDKVIPIEYGLPMPDENGNDFLAKKHYLGGCFVSNCDPSWYCERDKLKF